MSEEQKKPISTNKEFAKMRVHGKKGAGKPRGKFGSKPGFKPGFKKDSADSRYSGAKRHAPGESASPSRGARFDASRQARGPRREGSGPARGPRREGSTQANTVSPSRREAAKALFGIENGAKIADVLEIKRGLIPEDEALLRELVYGCTRQKRLLDHHLNVFCKTEYEKLPVEIKVSLRLGLYQLLFLSRVPAHAAVFESVNLVKQAGHEAMAGFVNAVLRTIETKKETLELVGKDELDTLAIKYSHPTWVVKRWAKQWPLTLVEKVLQADNQPHPVFLNVQPGEKENVKEKLGQQKVNLSETGWPSNTLQLKNHEGGLFSGESFEQGHWIVQDWVPQAMLELLPLKDGQRVWDVCAAPGGKTIGLAWRVGEKGYVTASDSSPERRKRLQENLKRTGLKQVLVFDHEIEKLSPAQKFDLAWVDAPCSGTGVLARRADLRWKIKVNDILDHGAQQKDLLEQAQGHLYPKGYLVYSTCSLEVEENEKVIEFFLKDHSDFKIVSLTLPEGLDEVARGDHGYTFLPTDRHDGGFISVLTRD